MIATALLEELSQKAEKIKEHVFSKQLAEHKT